MDNVLLWFVYEETPTLLKFLAQLHVIDALEKLESYS